MTVAQIRMGMRAPFAQATLHNALVAVWVGDPTAEALELFGQHLAALARRHAAGVFVLNVISETAGMPDGPARQLLRDQFEAMRGSVQATAIVLEKRGIFGPLSRAILSGLLIASGRPFPMAIYVDRDEAADWLAQYEGTPPAYRMLELIATLERQLAA